jgi:hypothetical protein
MKLPCLLLLLMMLAATVFTAQQSGSMADLQPELKQALSHDDTCFKSDDGMSSGQALAATVATEPILVGGRQAGIIAAPQDACDCANGNCSTFVYLKSADGYKLALEERLSSLKPMKIVKHGMPSLSGKLQLSAGQEETTVFDWSGRQYQPSLCATVTQRKNVRLPSIVRHPCKEAASTTTSR